MITQLPTPKTQTSFFGASRINATTALILLVIVAVGAALRFHLLEVRGFGDEAARWTFASLPWSSFWKEVGRDEINMVFYYLLLRGWLVLGDSEWIIRSLSVVLGVATLPALYLLGSRLFGRKAGLISAALLAVHTFHIRYSQEARSYSLLTLLLVLSTYFFISAMEVPSQKKYWIGYLLTSALACYSHLFAFLVLGAQWLSLGLPRLRQIGNARLSLVMSIFALLTGPIGVFMLFQSKAQLDTQMDWIPPLTWESFIGFAYFFTGDFGRVLLWTYIILSLFALGRLFRSSSGTTADENDKWHLRLVLFWLVLPFFIVVVGSLFKPLFQPRYLLMCLPALVLLAGLGMTELNRFVSSWGRLVIPILFTMMIVLSVRGTQKEYQKAGVSRNSFGPMTQYVLDHQKPQDAIFFFRSPSYMPFNYYVHLQKETQRELPVPTIVFPPIKDVPPGEAITPTKDEVEAAIGDRERVWLVLNRRTLSNPRRGFLAAATMIRETFQEKFRIQEERTFPGPPKVDLALYVRTTSEKPDESRGH
jgi:mannosyltransferase